MKVSIIYSSRTGGTERVANLIEEGVKRVDGIEVKSMNLREESQIDKDFINNCDAIIFGTPTYYANISWEMKKWFDESKEYNLEGKLGAAFATANCRYCSSYNSKSSYGKRYDGLFWWSSVWKAKDSHRICSYK